jgi:hypothetical protein
MTLVEPLDRERGEGEERERLVRGGEGGQTSFVNATLLTFPDPGQRCEGQGGRERGRRVEAQRRRETCVEDRPVDFSDRAHPLLEGGHILCHEMNGVTRDELGEGLPGAGHERGTEEGETFGMSEKRNLFAAT